MRIAAIAAIVLAGAIATSVGQEPTAACLHGPQESPDQLARRRAALTLARQINTEQQAVFRQEKRFRPLADLPGVQATVDGFAVNVTADETTYVFSVKDTRDPCRFAFFSDQEGLIYTAQPIR